MGEYYGFSGQYIGLKSEGGGAPRRAAPPTTTTTHTQYFPVILKNEFLNIVVSISGIYSRYLY